MAPRRWGTFVAPLALACATHDRVLCPASWCLTHVCEGTVYSQLNRVALVQTAMFSVLAWGKRVVVHGCKYD